MPHPRKRLPSRARIGERKLRTLSRKGPRTGTKLRKKTPLESVGTELGQDAKLPSNLTSQTYMGMYGELKKWGVAEFSIVKGKTLPSLPGIVAHEVYDYFRDATTNVIRERMIPGGWDQKLTDPLTNPMPAGGEDIVAKLDAMEMMWRPYWNDPGLPVDADDQLFWNTLRATAIWLDVEMPAGHLPKPFPIVVTKKKKKKKKPGHGTIILILAGLWVWSRKTRSR